MSLVNEINHAEALVEQRKLRSAQTTLEEALAKFSDPVSQVLLSFQLGALYWGEIGNGEKARQFFKQTIDQYNKNSELQTASNQLPPLEENSYENMMLLSLSYDEYQEWAGCLEVLEPTNDILNVQRPRVQELHERGFSWGSIMSAVMAGPHIMPETVSFGGRYASGAAILQLVLKHRRSVRLSREEWQTAAVGYGGAVLAAVSEYGMTMHKLTGDDYAYPHEFIFMIDDALPLVEEYVNANPSDEHGQKIFSDLKETQRRAATIKEKKIQAPRSQRYATPPHQVSQKSQCAECKTGMGLVNAYRPEAMASGQIRGSLQCNQCNRIYCLDCSDTSIACYCGSHFWQERPYVPLEPDPSLLFDETGELLFFMRNSSTTYVTPQMANLPANINPRHLNTYLKTRMRANSPASDTPQVPIRVLIISLMVGSGVYWYNNSWGWAIGVTILSYIVLGALSISAQGTSTPQKKNKLDLCPNCSKPIEITSQNPSSAWKCPHCAFNHFDHWKTHSSLAQQLRG